MTTTHTCSPLPASARCGKTLVTSSAAAPARARPPDRRVPLLDHARRGRLRATAVRGRGHLRARPQAHRREEAGERVGGPHLCARLTSVRYPQARRICGRAPGARRALNDLICVEPSLDYQRASTTQIGGYCPAIGGWF